MVVWNRIIRLFRFSGILGQPPEIPEKRLLHSFPPPEFPEYLVEWKAPLDVPPNVQGGILDGAYE